MSLYLNTGVTESDYPIIYAVTDNYPVKRTELGELVGTDAQGQKLTELGGSVAESALESYEESLEAKSVRLKGALALAGGEVVEPVDVLFRPAVIGSLALL